MPPLLTKDSKRSHEENRFVTCALCYNESGHKASKKISGKFEKIIQSFEPHFSLNNPKYGASLCLDCYFKLGKLEKKKIEDVHKSEHFGKEIPKQLRSDPDCSCMLCIRARMSGPAFATFRNKYKKNKPGRPARVAGNTSASGDHRRCGTCFTEVNIIYLQRQRGQFVNHTWVHDGVFLDYLISIYWMLDEVKLFRHSGDFLEEFVKSLV